MKYSSTTSILTALFAGSLFLSSCKQDHEIHKKPLKVQTTTWYRVSPATPTPVVVNGTTYTGFVYFPGGGTGHASHIGDCAIYFNQLAYGPSPDAAPAGAVAAPLTDAPLYPVTGAPLPLIQAGDFSSLSSALSTFHIPASVHEKIVNCVLSNNKGDAIFLSAITGSGGNFPISETKVGFKGKALVVTGRGKFSHAIGEVDYEGYFNVVDANDAEFNAEGWIAY